MATVYVILAENDAALLRRRVLPALPSNGYEHWLGRGHVAADALSDATLAQAMGRCRAILAIVSPALLVSPAARRELALALVGEGALIVVRLGALDAAAQAALPPRLQALPQVDFGSDDESALDEARRLLAALLPPPLDDRPAVAGAPIEWNEQIFSAALRRATARHDHARACALVDALAGHLKRRPDPYPAPQAYADLQLLRQDRAFELMRRLAEAVLASGTRQDGVRRLYAQALIETRAYEFALEVLKSIIDMPDSSPREVAEAHGLVGRVFKQMYVEAPHAPGAPERLQRAIAAYAGVYDHDPRQLWHGVNAASCLLRAARDFAGEAPAARAREIAAQVLGELARREHEAPLEVWDCASRVEALLALQRYGEAEAAVERYICHGDMQAFEVSSTLRQFEQVLELGRRQPGAAILARLREAVERYRGGAARPQAARGAPAARPLVIRLRDPGWVAEEIVDLELQQRLGTIVTARGSAASVRALLADPGVISVDESRPAGRAECDRSVPFIGVAAQYPGAGGPYQETGDGVLVAIIDDGIDLLHRAFLDAAGQSRILGVWDQTASSGTPPPGFGYGHFHDATAIAAAVRAGQLPPGLQRNDDGHGTHVASIAAGRAAGEFAGGVAPDARLLVVVSGAGGPTGYSQCHIEALAFIDAFAKQHGLPVVVNLSQGMNAGAHDGKSALEVAFDAFSQSGRLPGRVVVKSAGNERDKNGHAKVTLLSDALEPLRWQRAPGADHTERLELWWSSADEVECRLRDPAKNWTDWTGTNTPERAGTLPAGGPYRLVFTKRHVDNGDSLLAIELGSPVAPAALGEWVLELHGITVPEGGNIHAWIERTQGTPSAFLNHADEGFTLSIPATAASVIAVGAVDASRPIQLGPFSSYGPTRDGQQKPLVSAPGVKVRAARGGSDDGARVSNGTSMAAPHVTGAIALLLSRAAKAGRVPNSNQIAGALRQKTLNYSARWDPGQGWGVINVAALLAAF